jgi:hypothetical protein
MRLMPNSAFGRTTQALSASPLSHAERPLGLAFLLYPAFSCGVQRKRMKSVAALSPRGGRPRGLGDLGRTTALRTFPLLNFPRLAFCIDLVAQRQLPGSYPFPLSILSSVVPSGRAPMSSRK